MLMFPFKDKVWRFGIAIGSAMFMCGVSLAYSAGNYSAVVYNAAFWTSMPVLLVCFVFGMIDWNEKKEPKNDQ